jgi:hypothetical protein
MPKRLHPAEDGAANWAEDITAALETAIKAVAIFDGGRALGRAR